MKSNVCSLEKGSKDLEAIFIESQRVADYNGLSHKQALQLRLLCEEIDGMLPNIIEDYDGELWIDFENGVCKVNVSLEINEILPEEKEGLINLSRTKKNAAAVGIVGKIRDILEDFFLGDQDIEAFATTSGTFCMPGYNERVDYYYLWSLEQYRKNVKEDEAESWDELEKSVIASVADDVIVGVRGKRASIVIVKKFA